MVNQLEARIFQRECSTLMKILSRRRTCMILLLQQLLRVFSILPGITLLGCIADPETWHQYDGYVSVG